MISNVSKSKLRKLNLLPKTDVDIQSGYWKILYGYSNCNRIVCSLLKLTYLDDFESYEAQLTDFNYDSSSNKIIPHETYTCRNVFFNEDKKIIKVIFESGLLESRQDDFVLEYSEEDYGKLKRITSRCLRNNASINENSVSVGFCFGEISRISEADIESYGIRKRGEVKKAYRQGLITPEQLISFLNNYYEKITKTSTYKTLAANVMLEQLSSCSEDDTNKNAKDFKKDK